MESIKFNDYDIKKKIKKSFCEGALFGEGAINKDLLADVIYGIYEKLDGLEKKIDKLIECEESQNKTLEALGKMVDDLANNK